MVKKVDDKRAKFMESLSEMDGAINEYLNPHANVIPFPSPSLGFIFGNGWGLPRGYTAVMYGKPKGGKSLVCNATIGEVQRAYPNSFVVKFDTEFREQVQLTPEKMKVFGIDPSRYKCFSVNTPNLIFDRIENELAALIEQGCDIALVIIDSISSIQGRRTMNADSVMKQQIGDRAQTLGDGFKRILPIQRKCNFAMLLTDQVRVEMDEQERDRGNQFKMAASLAVQHYAEYFMFVEPLLTKAGRTDILEQTFVDSSLKDMDDYNKGEIFAHKVRVTMKNSSLGPKGRVAIFTTDDNKGVINTNEEILILGKRRGVIDVGGAWLTFGEKRWNGAKAMLQAMTDDPTLGAKILQELRRRDQLGLMVAQDTADAAASEAEDALLAAG